MNTDVFTAVASVLVFCNVKKTNVPKQNLTNHWDMIIQLCKWIKNVKNSLYIDSTLSYIYIEVICLKKKSEKSFIPSSCLESSVDHVF